MQSIKFSEIRSIRNGQQDGFEEFVCQLASNIVYNNPEAKFVNNNGTGGDGGVECYWKFKSGEEYGWQAKFFLNTLGKSQWNQIENSFKSAINKHPNLTKYYICLPRKFNNSFKTRNNQSVITERDNWDKNKKKWNEIAKRSGRNIEIVLWDEGVMSNLLINDNKNGPGIAKYWFDQNILTMDLFRERFSFSRESLGPRYSEENNVDLPISEKLNILSRNDIWHKKVEELLNPFFKVRNEIKFWKLNDDVDLSAKQALMELKKNVDVLYPMILRFPDDELILFKKSDILNRELNKVKNNISILISASVIRSVNSKNNMGIESYSLTSSGEYIKKFIDYINGNEFESGKERLLLVTGIAGSGKSHLLCDFSKKQLDKNNPVLFLLGQHYAGGNPMTFLSKELNIMDDKEVLPALNSMGFAIGKQVVIVIDAINEGNNNFDWPEYLVSFISKFKSYSNISLIFSCRDTYESKLIPPDVLKGIPQIEHVGFSGNRSTAARQYLNNYDISAPDIPFLAREFTNPLFLRTICQSMRDKGEHNFPEGILKFERILSMYRYSIENRVRQKLRISSNDIISAAIDKFIKAIYPNNLSGISYVDAYKIFKDFDSTGSGSILEELIDEGLLDKDVSIEKDGNNHDIVRFTFERFSDYYVSENILSSCKSVEDLKKLFLPSGELGKLLIKGINGSGILEVLCIEIPNKFHCEVSELIDWNKREFIDCFITEERFEDNFFLESLISRNNESFDDNTLEIFNKIKYYDFSDHRLDILLRVSLEKGHPWNADFLDKELIKMSMPERDNYWSTYVAINGNNAGNDGIIRNIIMWSEDSDFKDTGANELRLLSIILLWFTTTVNRTLRQHAIKLLAKTFIASPENIIWFIKRYSMLNDPYLVIGLYSAVYGAILHINKSEIISLIIKEVPWKNLIENKHSNILIRDCLTGIHKYCEYLGIDTSPINIIFPINKNKILPQLSIPTKKDIDLIDENRSSIKSSVMVGLNDFGKYSMYMIRRWSETKIKDFYRPKKVKEYASEYFEPFDKLIKNKVEQYKEYSTEIKIINKSQNEFSMDNFNLQKNISFGEDNESLVDKEKVTILEERQKKIIRYIVDNTENTTENQITRTIEELDNDNYKEFDVSNAERWVVKRAYDLGWTAALFESFEKQYCGPYSRINDQIERIGKKYQWISLYELLAVLSEQNYYLSEGYSDIDDSEYYGIWQFDLRDSDPTNISILNEKNKQFNSKNWCNTPRYNKFPDFMISDQRDWIKDNSDINLKQKLSYIDNENGDEWITLFNYESWSKRPFDNDNYEKRKYESNLWYRISSIIVRNSEFENIVKNVSSSSQSLMDPYIISYPNNQNQQYLWEYPWFNIYPELTETIDFGNIKYLNNQKCLSPIYYYSWSTGGQEHTLDESNDYYLPSRKLIKDINMINLGRGRWGFNDNVIFFNRINNDSSKNVLMKKEILLNWLLKNDLTIIWFIGGEKMAYNARNTDLLGNMEFDGVFYMNNRGLINGSSWKQK